MWKPNNGCEHKCPWCDHGVTEYLVDPKVINSENKKKNKEFRKEMKAFDRAKEREKDYDSYDEEEEEDGRSISFVLAELSCLLKLDCCTLPTKKMSKGPDTRRLSLPSLLFLKSSKSYAFVEIAMVPTTTEHAHSIARIK